MGTINVFAVSLQPRIPMFSKVAPRIASGLRHQIASPTLLRPINRCFSAGSDMSQLQEVLNLREAMKTDTRKAMPFTEFEGLCAQHGIEDPSKLAAHFHQSGVALHFPNGPAGTDNVIFLDPEHTMQTMFGALSNDSEAETKQESAQRLAVPQAEVAKLIAPLQEKLEQIAVQQAEAARLIAPLTELLQEKQANSDFECLDPKSEKSDWGPILVGVLAGSLVAQGLTSLFV